MEFLPPGVGFFPSELFTELNLYQYHPFELSFAPSFSFEHRRHFFCFTAKIEEEVTLRHCKSGFWLKNGNARDITVGAGNVVLGKKSLFVFYFGNSVTNAIKTSWTLYEYALADTDTDTPLTPFVVCRVFDCPRGLNLESEFGQIFETRASEDVNLNFDGGAAGPSNQNEKCVTLIINITLYLDDVTTEQQIDRAVMEGDFIELADLS